MPEIIIGIGGIIAVIIIIVGCITTILNRRKLKLYEIFEQFFIVILTGIAIIIIFCLIATLF